MRVDVLVAGSLHHDVIVEAPRLPAKDETLAGSSVAYAFGGKGGNQAIACARHGAATAFAGCVGDDDAGRFMRAHLEQAGIGCGLLAVDPRHASGMSVAIVDAKGDYSGVIVSSANLHLDADAVAIPPGCKFLVLQNEVPEAVNRAIAAKARGAGARVLLNAAPARALDSALLELTDILIVNRVEAATLVGSPATGIVEAKAITARLSGPSRAAVVTMGAEGLAWCMPEAEPAVQPVFPVRQISSHGAGDCFVGALAARMAQGDDLQRALPYASAAAALHVSTPPGKRGAIGTEAVRRMIAAHPIR